MARPLLCALFVILTACGSAEEQQTRRAEAWLSLLVEHRDEEALAMLNQGPLPLAEFSGLVNRRLGLRSHTAVRWTSVAIEGQDYRPLAPPIWRLEAVLESPEGSHQFECRVLPSGTINAVRVDGRTLMPPVYGTPHRAPPPTSLLLNRPSASVDGGTLSVRGYTSLEPGEATVRLDARCLHGDRWFRQGLDRPMHSAGTPATEVEGQVRLEPSYPTLCEARLSVMQAQTRRATLCWTPDALVVGPCPRRPSPRPPQTCPPPRSGSAKCASRVGRCAICCTPRGRCRTAMPGSVQASGPWCRARMAGETNTGGP